MKWVWLILFSLILICIQTFADKVKRDYFITQSPYSTENPFSSSDYSSYSNYGRKLKNPDATAQIIKQVDEKQSDGSYNFEYQTDNGIHARETSSQNGDERVVRGSYSYVGPDGIVYSVNYIADKNGYRAYGAHLPIQPDAIAPIINQPTNYPSSTISPIYNRPVRIYPTSTGFPFSSTPAPILSQTLVSPQRQEYSYPTTPFPITRTTFVSPSAQGFEYSSTSSPITRTTFGSPSAPAFAYSPTPITNNHLFSSSAADFTYSTTPSPYRNTFTSASAPGFTYSSSTPRPFVPLSSGYREDDTVYITPPPKTFINPLSSEAYLQRELLPPFSRGSAYQDNFDIPNVRPLISEQNSYAYRPY